MIDSIYGGIQGYALFLPLLAILLFDRSRWNWRILAYLGMWYVGAVTLQEITGTNSPFVTGFALAGLICALVVRISHKTRTMWPLVIAGLLAASMASDLVFYIIHNPELNRLHQDIGGVIWYLTLIWLAIHPDLKRRAYGKWSYT